MIPKQEVLSIAKAMGVEPRIVEKNYVLSWILAGINQHPILKEKWIFKGGTCLKKCYFETYRMSEDLDFTAIDPSHINENFLKEAFAEILQWVYEQTGIELPQAQMKFDVHPDPSKQYVEASLYYIGLLQQRGSLANNWLRVNIS